MSFDGIFLKKLTQEFEILKGGRITKISESGNADFLLQIRSNSKNYSLFMSFIAEYARIHLANKTYEAPATPSNLVMLLRKHIDGYIIKEISSYDCDRIISIKMGGYNEMRDYNEKWLILEVMGRYSNLILCDSDFIIIESLHHDFQLESKRNIIPNAKYEYITSEKINPYTLSKLELEVFFITHQIEDPKALMNTFKGVSMSMAYSVFFKEGYASRFYRFLNDEYIPSIFINQKDKKDFYFFSEPFEAEKTFTSLSELLEEFYFENDRVAKIKSRTNDVMTFIKKQLIKFSEKIVRLERDKIEAGNADIYKNYGELLLSIPSEKKKNGIDKIEVFDYVENKEISIPLDIRYDINQNSQKYFKKYRKMKSSIYFIDEQIKLTLDEIEYFKILETQIQNADIKDISDIIDELVELKYLKQTKKDERKKKPSISTYVIDDMAQIMVGKNNLQNEYLSHKIAKPNELWFHVKGGPGSHVILRTEREIRENDIRLAAMLAAYFSFSKESSSVPVDYTYVKNLKKIPGKRNCFVQIKNEKTIYIDPNENLINSLKVKKQ